MSKKSTGALMKQSPINGFMSQIPPKIKDFDVKINNLWYQLSMGF